MKKVGRISLGCAKNRVDSENLLGMLTARGYEIVSDPAEADVLFVNTCGFIESAKEESIDAILEMAQYKKLGNKQLFVTGCLAQRYPEALMSEIPEIDAITAGDIGAVPKLTITSTGDSLCDKATFVKFEDIEFPAPVTSMAIMPKAKGDEEKISAGLQKMMEEDKTITLVNNAETKQQVLSGIGDQHIEVVVSKLKTKYSVDVTLAEPKVPYRETIRKTVKAEGKHKKQSGGHGQYGHVWIEFEPADTDELIFEEKVFGGAVPKNFFPAVEKGLRDSMAHGVLAGYPVVGLKATLYDGSYHSVDSSEMAFKTAANLAFKAGLTQAAPVLLEPIGTLTVNVPNTNMGDVMGDVNKRRGRVLGSEPQDDGTVTITADVPMAEMTKFATDLRSMTQGRGSFAFSFRGYEQAPDHIAKKIIEESAKE